MNQTASKKHKNIPLFIYQLDLQNTIFHLTRGSNSLANSTIQVLHFIQLPSYPIFLQKEPRIMWYEMLYTFHISK